MQFSFSPDASSKGFIISGLGSHSSRTIMVAELKLLLSICPPSAPDYEYRKAIIEDNVLLKQTSSTRLESNRRLRELYGINPSFITFRALRDLWDHTIEAQPLLAMLTALSRDPVLRSTTSLLFTKQPGNPVDSQMFSGVVNEKYPNLNPTTLANFGRHIASSWTQSGHLVGRANKIRGRAQAHASSCAYALFLGYLCGERGDGLFTTPWAQVLDTPVYTLRNLAKTASQYGWLEYRQSGSITDISFRYLLREKGDTLA